MLYPILYPKSQFKEIDPDLLTHKFIWELEI